MILTSTASRDPSADSSQNTYHSHLAKHCKRVAYILKEGAQSPFVQFIEKVFQMLNNIQLNCLSVKHRSKGVEKFLEAERMKHLPDMLKRYDEMLTKERKYLVEIEIKYMGKIETERLNELIEAVRKVAFKLFHKEQSKFRKKYPYECFLTKWNERGQQNTKVYVERFQAIYAKEKTVNDSKEVKSSPAVNDFQMFGSYVDQSRKELNITEPTRDFEAGIVCALEAITRIREQNPNDPFEEDAEMNKKIIELLRSEQVNAGQLTPEALIQSWQERLQSSETTRKSRIKEKNEKEVVNEINKKWESCLEKEKELFEQFTGLELKDLRQRERQLIQEVKGVFFRIFHEEQKEIAEQYSPLPFVSIFNEEGELNEDYWIDLLDARARKNGEKTLDSGRHLRSMTDYDAVSKRYSPAVSSISTVDETGMRDQSAITPKYCMGIIEHMHSESQEILKKAEELLDDDESQVKADAKDVSDQYKNRDDLYEVIYNNDEFSLEERIRFLQNVFCEALCSLYYARSETRKIFESMNISYELKESTLFFPTKEQPPQPVAADSDEAIDEQMLVIDSEEFKEMQKIVEELKSVSNTVKPGQEDQLLGISYKLHGYAISLSEVSKWIEALVKTLEFFAKSLNKDKNEPLNQTKRRSSYHQVQPPKSSTLNESSERDKVSGLAKATSVKNASKNPQEKEPLETEAGSNLARRNSARNVSKNQLTKESSERELGSDLVRRHSARSVTRNVLAKESLEKTPTVNPLSKSGRMKEARSAVPPLAFGNSPTHSPKLVHNILRNQSGIPSPVPSPILTPRGSLMQDSPFHTPRDSPNPTPRLAHKFSIMSDPLRKASQIFYGVVEIIKGDLKTGFGVED